MFVESTKTQGPAYKKCLLALVIKKSGKPKEPSAFKSALVAATG
ncbi:cytochrome c [Acetobacter orientalis]|uniref:Cytochrome c n=1 Tax=Acetobacter orientalis TaxID=146474 RepID=A0A2Z5ZLM7_9PROT|nr:cytochrome c [Acetobacter orientalis]